MEMPWAQAGSMLARIGRDTTLALHRADSIERRIAAQDFIRERFAESYGARIEHFLPCLLTLEDADGVIHAAVGMRPAQGEALFLERYLDQPVDVQLHLRAGQTVSREKILEIGNLAAREGTTARMLIVMLTDLLVALGQRWVVFTGTATLLNSFARLGLMPLNLGQADPARMGDELADWGSYYQTRPQVMAGDIFTGHQRLLQQGLYSRLGYQTLYNQETMLDAACH